MQYLTFRLGESKYPDIIDILESIVSSMLPHENFNIEYAKTTSDELFKTLPISEVYGIWYLFFKVFQRMEVVKMYMTDYPGVLDRQVFDSAVEAACQTILLDENFAAKDFFNDEGLTFNLAVESEFYDAASTVYSIAMDMYDDLFARAIPSQQGILDVKTLKQKLEGAYTERLLDTAAQALVTGVNIGDRRYQGPEDSRILITKMMSELSTRISISSYDAKDRFAPDPISSYEAFKDFKVRNKVMVRDLYYMGIDPLDEVMCVRSQDIITIVADEGVGKTRFAVGQLYEALMQGLNVLYICGESAKIKIENMLLSTHLWSKYKVALSWDEIHNPEKIRVANDDVLEQRIIELNSAAYDLHTNEKYGMFIPQQSACYETFYDDIKATCEQYKVDLVIVDHVLALTSNGDFTPMGRLNTKQLRVTHLYQMEDLLVKDCNIAFLNLSHPSFDTSKDLKNGRRPSSRAGAESSESSRYSSVIGVLHNTEDMRNQDIVALYLTKARDVKQILEPMVMQRQGYPCQHVYDPNIQHMALGGVGDASEEDILALFEDEN